MEARGYSTRSARRASDEVRSGAASSRLAQGSDFILLRRVGTVRRVNFFGSRVCLTSDQRRGVETGAPGIGRTL